jgi:hypothetical protein
MVFDAIEHFMLRKRGEHFESDSLIGLIPFP